MKRLLKFQPFSNVNEIRFGITDLFIHCSPTVLQKGLIHLVFRKSLVDPRFKKFYTNCSVSVEPAIAVVEDVPPEIVCDTSSK